MMLNRLKDKAFFDGFSEGPSRIYFMKRICMYLYYMYKKYEKSTLLLMIVLIMLSGCACSDSELSAILKECKPRSMIIHGHKDNLSVNNQKSLNEIMLWLAGVELLDVRYASYPKPSIQIILNCENHNDIQLSMSYPRGQDYPQIIGYKGDFFSTSIAPQVKEFMYFKDKPRENSLESGR